MPFPPALAPCQTALPAQQRSALQILFQIKVSCPCLMILATPGQHSCNTRTSIPTTSGQTFL